MTVAALLTGLGAVIAQSAPTVDDDVEDALTTVVGWTPGLWRTVFIGALVLALLTIGEIVLRRRWALARDLVIAGIVLSPWQPSSAGSSTSSGLESTPIRLRTGAFLSAPGAQSCGKLLLSGRFEHPKWGTYMPTPLCHGSVVPPHEKLATLRDPAA